MADFDYQKHHSRPFYAPVANGPVKKGQMEMAHSKEDEVALRARGFTSPTYIRSEWPKSMFHKQTGECRPVGKLEWTDAQNAAAVENLGKDWTFDYVHPPKQEEKKAGGEGLDLGAAANILAEIKLTQRAIADQTSAHEETAASLHARIDELTGIVTAQDKRLSELENAATEAK